MRNFSGASRRRNSKWSKALIAPLAAVALLAGPAATPASADGEANGEVTVIVQKTGPGNGPETRVERLGGEIVHDLPIIDGFAATIRRSAIGQLASAEGVRHVTEDAPVQMHGLLGDVLGGVDSTVDGVLGPVDSLVSDLTTPKSIDQVVEAPAALEKVMPVPDAGTNPKPAGTLVTDPDFPSVHNQVTGAAALQNKGVTGKGTVVALVDTGVADLPDLQGAMVPVKAPNGSTKSCVDLSGENNCNDSYGHGTFLAGLIAGSGAASDGEFKGVAPDTKILSLKISGSDGSASVGKILFAIQWVASNKDTYGIDVLNLSLGTDSTQSYRYDPLNYAVERAWFSGIAVVVSAGNRGPDARTISKPADDPFVITTGAIDDVATATREDDKLPDFSSKGPTASDGLTKPDITAPGARLVSLRSPGSSIEEQFPGGGVDGTYRRGSGTSQSAAVISGAVALLKQAHPDMTPDQIKFALMNSTRKTVDSNPNVVGAGLLDIEKAVDETPRGEANKGVKPSRGWGSLRASQGTVELVAKDGNRLLGLLDGVVPIKGADKGNPTGGGWYGSGWYGGGWYGGGWYGGGWYGGGWYGGGWYGGGWYGGGWYGGSWYGGSWYGAWD